MVQTPALRHPALHRRLSASIGGFTALCSLVAITSCAVGPDYEKPPVETPAAYKEAGPWVKAQPADSAPKGKWWEVFRDPQLDGLMEQVSVSNQSLKAAEARYREATAAVESARAQLFPTLGANASASRSRSSLPGETGRRYDLSLNASWEPDFWGRVRRLVEASREEQEATAGDLENARLSLQGELATDYFQLRATDAQIVLFQDTVKAFQTSYTLTENRYRAGVAAKSDVAQAETQLKSTQAQEIDLRATRAQLEHAIAVLVGKPPATFSITPASVDLHIPSIPPGVPSTLLQRRPDVSAAERRAAEANARIGVAEAAYFPSIDLTANGGFSGAAIANLVSAPNRTWSLGVAAAETILDFGARSADVASARAAYDEAVANYRQAALGAFQDVEDDLATLHWLSEEASVQDEAARAARESVALTLNQYKAGTVSFLNVVIVQASQLSEDRSVVTVLERRLAASVALIRALGGTWEAAP
ncbi:MAG TPA: efflux transporter outer membrane subunit [Usitatibacter sp.]|nr:efflux transporter outer membrane subunit [Usitatibacter sp.]